MHGARVPTPASRRRSSACVSAVARLVHDGYAVEVLDTDGTVLAERIDGGDMAEVEVLLAQFATITARRDDSLAPAHAAVRRA